ncbi:chlorophyll a-b binding domain-containing protein [Mycetocola spongiae]|uniref:hypothetical protein n=1 Tax=Mycetocola spongiae TaxID=2859226 RepID=UPI001CF56DE0|nr:hypothetical protein [Mycetocola spongiae]UCR88685.1 hypothetical protein KXZ72_12070 [Mycetocola spongiae]
MNEERKRGQPARNIAAVRLRISDGKPAAVETRKISGESKFSPEESAAILAQRKREKKLCNGEHSKKGEGASFVSRVPVPAQTASASHSRLPPDWVPANRRPEDYKDPLARGQDPRRLEKMRQKEDEQQRAADSEDRRDTEDRNPA